MTNQQHDSQRHNWETNIDSTNSTDSNNRSPTNGYSPSIHIPDTTTHNHHINNISNPYNKLTPLSKFFASISTTTTTLRNKLLPKLNIISKTAIKQQHQSDINNNTNTKYQLSEQQLNTTSAQCYQSPSQKQETQQQLTNELLTSQQTQTTTDNPYQQYKNDLWGDPISNKTDSTIRIMFQNVHGLRSNNRMNNKWNDCIQTIHKYNIDILCLAETCTNWGKRRICQRYTKELQHALSTSTCIEFSRSNYEHDSLYLPGGVCQVSISEWATRIKEHLHDSHNMNRWTGTKYQLARHRYLFIITAYRVCKQDPQSGVYSSYKQQLLALRQRFPNKTESQLSPRQQFIIDLVTYVKGLNITTEDYLIISLDANEVIGEDNVNGLEKLMTELSLRDLFTQHHNYDCNISTYIGSRNRRIDYIVGTANLFPFIQQCGYLPFFEGIESDHRAAYLDLSTELTSGRIKTQRPQQRLIGQTTSKEEVRNYKQYIYQQFEVKDIPNRVQQLYNNASFIGTADNDFNHQLNKIDDEITEIMLNAEKTQCRAKHKVIWNQSIHQASLLIKYWNIKHLNEAKQRDKSEQHRNKAKQRDISEQLEQIYHQLTEEQRIAITTTTVSIKTNLKNAVKAKQQLYFDIKQRQEEKQQINFEADAQFLGITTEQAAARYKSTNITKRLFSYLQTVYNRSKGRKVSTIEVPNDEASTNQEQTSTNPPPEWKCITNPNEIAQLIIQRNINHFGQANETPFATEPLTTIFGYTGTTEATTELIQHQKVPDIELTNKGAKQLLATLSDGNQLPPINDDITEMEFWNGFKTWREATSTSPSGRHLGHYKTLLIADGHDNEYDDTYINPSKIIKTVHFQLAMAAVKAGTTINRWCNSSTLMLEKQPGVSRINKLRVIHIYEADYNLLLKLIWARKLVWHCHIHNKLHASQAGSRPNNRCIDVVLKKELNYEYARLTRTTLATIDNDAKSCYDRILCNIAMMTSRYYGMTERACKFHSSTLQNMRFKVRTSAGDSEQTYQHTNETPIHGTGQGSCASPCLWLLISNLLLRCHGQTANGMTRHDVLKNNITTTTAEGFVDDVALLINNDNELQEQLQLLEILILILIHINYDFKLWQEILIASGGKLELVKCFLYILAWRFNKYGDPVSLTKQEMAKLVDINITIADPETGQTVPLEHKEVHEAHRTLGAWKTIAGNHEEQVKVLQEKSNKIASQTKIGQLTRFQARRAYTAIYIPAMTYSLVASNLSSNELHKIQSKALFAFLPAMGYEPTFPRAVAHGPRKYGGLNIGNLHTEMFVAKIGALIEHIRANTELGNLMITNINWTQLQTGIQKPILESQQLFPYLSITNWFIHITEFLKEINATVYIRDIWRILLERSNDTTIMDCINNNNKLKNYEKRIFNNWRIYFQASVLSDISSEQGNAIHSYYWNYHRFHTTMNKPPRYSRHNWPIQQQPDISTFSIWRTCLTSTFNIKRNGQLPFNLGQWTTTPSTSRNDWSNYLDPTTNLLYINQRDGNFWIYETEQQVTTWHTRNHQTQLLTFSKVPEDTTTELPNRCIPVSITEHVNGIQVSNTNYQLQPRTTIVPTTFQSTFDNHITSLANWKIGLLQHWNAIDQQQLVNLLETETEILIASDGGYDPETGEGTFGAIIATTTVDIMSTMGYAANRCDLGSSFRSELYGLLAATVLLHETILYYNIQIQQSITITTYIDNKGVGTRINNHRQRPMHLGTYMLADMDIELTVLDTIRALEALGFLFKPIRHVKAHQDETVPHYLLSRDARLNIMADELATVARQEPTIEPTKYQLSDSIRAMLYINKTPITAKYQQCIREAYWTDKLFKYYRNKFQWDQQTLQQIHWKSFDAALQKLSHSDCQRIQKYNINHLHTNVREQYFHPHKSALCPSCNNYIETNYHIMQCQETSRQQVILEWERSLLDYLSSDHTPQTVKTTIMIGIQAWIKNEDINEYTILTNLQNIPLNVTEAFQHQTEIGWGQFTRGKLSTKWLDIIKDHLHCYHLQSSKLTPTRWATNLITIIWQGVLNAWDNRNREMHGNDKITSNTKKKEKLLQEAEYLQQQARENNCYNTHWLNKPINELQQYTVMSLKAWVRNARTISRLYFQEQKSKIKINVNSDGHLNPSQSELAEGGGTVNSSVSTEEGGEMESSSRS